MVIHMDNNNKTAVITGASSGIGRECAITFARKGYNLVLVARRKERLEEISRSLEKSYKIKVKIIVKDLSIEDNCISLLDEISGENIEVFINNAGFGEWGRFELTSEEQDLKMIKLNINSLHILTKRMINYYKDHNIRGKILNVASSAGLMPAGPYMATYYASKSYVASLSRAVAFELNEANSGIYVGCLCPGPVNTEFNSVAGVDFTLNGVSASYVIEYAVRQMEKGKTLIIPSLIMKLSTFMSRLIPSSTLIKIVAHQQKKKKKG